jgi:hypothetical protein
LNQLETTASHSGTGQNRSDHEISPHIRFKVNQHPMRRFYGKLPCQVVATGEAITTGLSANIGLGATQFEVANALSFERELLITVDPERSGPATLQSQGHLWIGISDCTGAQRRERDADKPDSFPHRKLNRENLRTDRCQGRAVRNRYRERPTSRDDLEVSKLDLTALSAESESRGIGGFPKPLR